MSEGPSSELRAKWQRRFDARRADWRRDYANASIDPEVRRANEAEYVYTHGYAPSKGTWAVPLYWQPAHVTVLGEIRWIEYVSRKVFEGPKTFIFNHKHVHPNRPFIARGYNDYGDDAYMILGGGYKITAHGIEDDPLDERVMPGPDVPTFRVPRALPKSVVGMGTMFGVGYSCDVGMVELDLSRKRLVLAYKRAPGGLYIVPDR